MTGHGQEAARMACCAYDRLVRRFSALPDEQVAAELRDIAALAAVAEDQALKAAADRMSEAAGEEDRVGVEEAARVFVDEAWRLVPDQRLAIP